MLQFGLSNAPFWQNPSTNRIIRLQPIQPFIGNNFWVTSDVTGNAYYSNSSAATYNAVITAPPSPSINFSFTVTATNLGLVNVSNIVSIPGNAIQTIPSGMAAWPIYVSDARYAFNSNAPGGNAPLSANQSTNLVASAIPTNYWNSAATLWLSNLLFLGNVDTNLNLPGTEMTATTNAGPPGSVTFNVNTNSPNGVATVGLLNFASNALANSTGSGISAATGTNIAVFVVAQSNAGYTTITGSNPAVFVNTNDYEKWTNGATSIRYSNAYSFLYTNNLPQLTNTFLNTNTAASTYVPIQSGIANFLTASNQFTVVPQGAANGQVTILSTVVGETNSIVSLTTGGLGFQINPGGLGALGGNDATVVSNGLTSGFITANQEFIGNGFGITNAGSTNISGPALAQATNGVAATVSNLVVGGLSNGMYQANASNITNVWVAGLSNANFNANTNAAGINSQAQVNTGSNSLWTLGTNFSDTNFVFNQGGGATNTFITNSPLYSGTNIGIGTYPVIYQSTNLVAFISSGTTSLTNALYVWVNSGNYYTNTQNSGWITNNGSVWQVFSSAAVQLFSNAKLTGAWTLQGGVGAAMSDYGAYLRGDGLFIIGIVNSTNITTNINSTTGSATNAIALLNGFGTNTTLFTTVAMTNTFPTYIGGQNNTMSLQSFDAILSGQTNNIHSSSQGVIVAGEGNLITGGSTQFDVIGGGQSNQINASFSFEGGGLFNTLALNSSYSGILGGSYNSIGSGTTGASQSTIIGGEGNVINDGASGTSFNVILGGESNSITGNNALTAGFNASATNNNTFVWSDGAVFKTITNGTFIIHATNGVSINTNYANGYALAVLGNLNVNGGSQITTESNTVGISGTTIGTNIAVGVNTNLYQTTNVINIYQAGTALATNGSYEWFSQNFYSNRFTSAILTNNGAQWLLVTNGTTLYNSVTLINNSWTAVAGAGTASSQYGYYHLLNGEVDIGITSSTNTPIGTVNLINTASNQLMSLTFTNANAVYVETNGNDGNAIYGYKNRPWRSIDVAAPIAIASNAPLFLGAGTFYFTNCITNAIRWEGSGASETFLVAYTPNTNSASVCPAINLQDYTVLKNFDIEPQPSSSGNGAAQTNYQALIGWNNANFAPVSATMNNAIIDNVACTNAGSDFFYFTGESYSTNVNLRNLDIRAISDCFVDFSDSLNAFVDNCKFKSIGISQFAGFLYTGSAFRIANGNVATWRFNNDYFYTGNTNGYPFSRENSSKLRMTFIGCTFTNANPSGGPLTNLALTSAGNLGSSNYVNITGNEPRWDSISVKTSGVRVPLYLQPPPFTNMPPAGNYYLDGTNTCIATNGFVILNPLVSGAFWTNTYGFMGTLVAAISEGGLTGGMLLSNGVTTENFTVTNSVAPQQVVFRVAPKDYVVVTQQNGTMTIQSSSFRP